MSMTKVSRNAVPMESSTALRVCILIDGKEILPQGIQNEEVMKRVFDGLDACRMQECPSSQRNHLLSYLLLMQQAY